MVFYWYGAQDGEANTVSSVGVGGVSIFKQKIGVILEFKSINAGSSKISITDDTGNDEVDIDIVEANIDHDALTNFVANEHIDHSSVSITAGTGLTGGGDLTTTRTIDVEDNVTLPGTEGMTLPTGTTAQRPGVPVNGELRYNTTTNKFEGYENSIWVDIASGGGGEANTASNVGTAGVGVFKGKSGVDLEFKKINAGSTKITITDDTGNDELDVDIDETNIDHDNLTNFVANEHINHTSVTLTAGSGLTGGGDISSNRTFDLDIDGLAADTAMAGTDILAIYDGANKKITRVNLEGSLDHDNLSNFVANEHIDWTSTSDNFLTTGTGFFGDTLTVTGTATQGGRLRLREDSDNGSHYMELRAADSIAANFTIKFPSDDGAIDEVLKSDGSGVLSWTGHDGLSGFVANEHIDHTSVTISAGTGLSGGGDISSNRTLNLSHLGIEALSDPNADRLLFWDDSETATGWLTLSSALSITATTLDIVEANIDHDSLQNFVANEHIDWTSASSNLITSGTGEFADTLSVKGTGSTQGTINLYERTDTGTNKITIQPPVALSADYTLTLPNDDGNANQVLKTNGSGTLDWVSHDDIDGFVANEHIDWTSASSNFSTSGTITGSSGAVDFGSATSLEIPNGAAPTVNAAGEIAVDTTITDYTGLIKYYDGTEELTVVGMPTANLSTTDGDIVAYSATNNEFEMISQSWVKISSSAASNDSSIDFTGLSSTYEMYVIVVTDVIPATDDVHLYLRTSTDGGSSYDSGASDYGFGVIMSASPNPVGTEDTAHSAMQISRGGGSLGNDTGESGNFTIRLYNPSATTKTFATWEGANLRANGSLIKFHTGGAVRESAADVDAIRFVMSSGNISSGTFTLYGVLS